MELERGISVESTEAYRMQSYAKLVSGDGHLLSLGLTLIEIDFNNDGPGFISTLDLLVGLNVLGTARLVVCTDNPD